MPYDPIPQAQKEQMGWLTRWLWKGLLIGDPPVFTQVLRERMCSPQPGDMVVDMSTLGRLLNHPAPKSDWCVDLWDGQFVRYVKDLGGGAHRCEAPDGATFTWSNCDIVAVPMNGDWP